jgi:predicted RecB family nuclease
MFTLDPYAARSCPLKTLHTFDPSAPTPATIERRSMPGAGEFNAEVLSLIMAGGNRVCDLRELLTEPSGVQEAACLAAMADGAEVIVSALLPRDGQGHRRGRAELLIRDSDGGYVPGTIKFQRALDARRDDREFTYSLLADLPRRQVSTGWRYRWSWRWANAIQLAHLWELLGPTGFRSQAAWAVVIGTERLPGAGVVATWLDLSEPNLTPSPGAPDQANHVSALERYHQEFSQRIELAQAAMELPGTHPLLLDPIVTQECSYCEWWPVCRPRLNDDDLSLRINKSPLDRQEITGLRSAGVRTVTQLAEADLEVLLPSYLPLVAHRQGAEDHVRLAQRRSRMVVDGVELDRTTTGPLSVPHAEIEIDIDVETSRDDRVYLWGLWIGDATGSYYRHFSSFTDLDEAGEQALAVEAMTWLREFTTDRDVLVFHYSDYEVTRLARLAASGEEALTWGVDFAAKHFVDLFAIVRHNFFGANGLGLKAVARAGAGFEWRDDDPGGLNSMIWFDTAVHGASETERSLARERVLCYNEDDVRATAHLRSWLRQLS